MVLSDADILKQLNETDAANDKRVVDEGLEGVIQPLRVATNDKLSQEDLKKIATEFVLANLEGKPLSEVNLGTVEEARASSVEDRTLGGLANVPGAVKFSDDTRKLLLEQINDSVSTFVKDLKDRLIVDTSGNNPNRVEEVKKLLLGE